MVGCTSIIDGFAHRVVHTLWRTAFWYATITTTLLTACAAPRPRRRASSSVRRKLRTTRQKACYDTLVDVCKGPLILYEVPGTWGDMYVRRLAECERCGAVLVIADELDEAHAGAELITDRRVPEAP